MKICNHKLKFFYRLHEECIIGMALKTDMVLAIRRKQVQLTLDSRVSDMKFLINIATYPIPILVLKHTQTKWLKLAKKHNLVVIVSEIFSSNRLFKAKIHLASKQKEKNKKKQKKNIENEFNNF